MVTIDLLNKHPYLKPALLELWQREMGRQWYQDTPLQQIEQWFDNWLNEDRLPLAYVALKEGKLIGCCTLEINDGIRPDLTPWLGDLIIEPSCRGQNIGDLLIKETCDKARELGYDNIYLFTYELWLNDYYQKRHWQILAKDRFKNRPITILSLNLK